MRRLFFYLLVGLLVLCLGSESAIANMSSPWSPGDPIGEPVGVFRQLDIVTEKLSFDLRSLAHQNSGQVTATYQIRNSGKSVSVDLVFISPGIKTGNVTLDDKKVSANIIPKPSLPQEWDHLIQLPIMSDKINWADSGRISVSGAGESALSFQTILPSGEHSLQVSYEIRPGTYNGNDIYREYNIGYLLAPARSWATFGKLDIQVNLPHGWEVVTTPLKLPRQGDTLTGSFAGLPSDTFAIATRPTLWLFSLIISIIVEVSIWIMGLIACVFFGQKLARIRYREGTIEWLLSTVIFFILMLCGGLMVPFIGLTGEYFSLLILDNGHLSSSWSYGQNILRLLVFPFIGFGLGIFLMPFAFIYWRYFQKT